MDPLRSSSLLLLLLLIGCSSGDGGPHPLERAIVECTGDETRCEAEVAGSGCSIVVGGLTADGGVAGGCADGGPARLCTRQCELDGGPCPEGWTCTRAPDCPAENPVRYCVPTAPELSAQSRQGCYAAADPRVCGFL